MRRFAQGATLGWVGLFVLAFGTTRCGGGAFSADGETPKTNDASVLPEGDGSAADDERAGESAADGSESEDARIEDARSQDARTEDAPSEDARSEDDGPSDSGNGTGGSDAARPRDAGRMVDATSNDALAPSDGSARTDAASTDASVCAVPCGNVCCTGTDVCCNGACTLLGVLCVL